MKLVYRSILVPVNGTFYAEEMVALACRLAAGDGAELHALYVFEVPRTMPIDAPAESELEKGGEILARAAEVAEAAGLHLETHLIRSRSAGASIVEEAERLQADLIVLGTGTETRVGGILFGATTNMVLKNAPCRVLVGRAAMEG